MRYHSIRASLTALGLLAIAACGSTGLGDVLGGVLNAPPGEETATVEAEIQANDAQRQVVQIRTENGEEGVVRWDTGTRVIYNDEEYSAAALERGDLVQMRLQQTSDGQLYTDYVVVTQSVQERTGVSTPQYETGLVRVEGTVTDVDPQTGRFQLRSSSAGTIVVTLPYNPPESTVDRFERLRTGDFVRVEGRYLTTERFEVVRFF